jgi:hypothetical protein
MVQVSVTQRCSVCDLLNAKRGEPRFAATLGQMAVCLKRRTHLLTETMLEPEPAVAMALSMSLTANNVTLAD